MSKNKITEKQFEAQVKDLAKIYGWLLTWLANKYILSICHQRDIDSKQLSKDFKEKLKCLPMAVGNGLDLLIRQVMRGCKKEAGVKASYICTDGLMNTPKAKSLKERNLTISAGIVVV